jgi:hypothetical protein
LVFLLAEHLDLNQITVGSKADVHMMTGRTGISSELLLTWACIANVYNLQQALLNCKSKSSEEKLV